MKFCELRPWEKFKLEEGKFTYIRLPDFPTDLIKVNCYCYDINEYRYLTGGSGVKLVEDENISSTNEKEVPKKVVVCNSLENCELLDENEFYRCPSCFRTRTYKVVSYCPDCGQKLDWGK